MKQYLTITDITPRGTKLLSHKGMTDVTRLATILTPLDCGSLFEQYEVNNNVEAIQHYVRSSLFADLELQFRWTLSSEPTVRNVEYVDVEQLQVLPHIDEEFLFGKHGYDVLAGNIESVELAVQVNYSPTLCVAVDFALLAEYEGWTELMARDIILKYLTTKIFISA